MSQDIAEFKPRQRRPGNALKPTPLPEFLERMLARGKAEIASPYRGVTTDGEAVSGLFPIMKTGLPLGGVVDAAAAFLASLTPEQRASATFDLENGMWRAWHNMHTFLIRHGALLEECSGEQRERAMALVRETMSAAGFKLARDVMRLNEHIGEITGRASEFGEWYYWMSILGTPSATEPWGWQIDGHHLIVNCFVLGDQMVITPNFMGSEPVYARFGKYAGTRVFQDEEEQGHALMSALEPEQQHLARIGMELPFDCYGTAFNDNLVLPYQGIPYDELTGEQRDRLWSLIGLYVGRARPGHAALKLDEVKRHLRETRFSWIGHCDATSPFYYRVHNPVILIEFDHQPGIALENDFPSRHHTHTLVRTPNGNDYGKDLLRQHYRQFDHARADSPHRQGKV
jgi:Protein of unknown function (DUF3500)